MAKEKKIMTLAEHDRKYHKGHYVEGMHCLFRKRREEGDDVEIALQKVTETEDFLLEHDKKYHDGKLKEGEKCLLRDIIGNKILSAEQLKKYEEYEILIRDHDYRCHGGHYKKGEECEFRKLLISGNFTQEQLDEATKKEMSVYLSRNFETDIINRGLVNNFLKAFNKKNKLKTTILPPDKNGNSEIHIWGTSENPDDLFNEGKMAVAVKNMGYRMTGFSIMKRKTENEDKKVWIVKMHTDRKPGEMAQKKDDSARVITKPSDELSDEQRSANLKRYGYKVENGKTVKRNGDEKKSAAQEYLDLVNGGEFCLGRHEGNAQAKRDREGEAEERRAYMRELGLDV